MLRNQHFHKSDAAYRESAHRLLLEAVAKGKITREDAALIQEFIAEKSSSNNLSGTRISKIVYFLITWREHIGPFPENTLGDIFTGIDQLKTATKKDGSPRYTRNTQHDFIKALKRFYLWLIDEGHAARTIKRIKVQGIRPPQRDTMTKTAEMMLSRKEVQRMIDAAQSLRDKAMIALLYEGGLRIAEIGDLTWGALKFDEWKCSVNVNTKTERPRYIPLVMARPYLAAWRSVYPGEATGDNWVFLTNRGKPLQYNGTAKILKVTAERAGIEKHITPHLFRHSRCTHLMREGYSESLIKKMLWGNLSSDMLSTYAHLVDSDVDAEIALRHGIKGPEHKRDTSLDPVQCPHCYTINRPGARFCDSCALELRLDVVEEKKSARDQIRSDPEFQAMIDDAVRRALAKSA